MVAPLITELKKNHEHGIKDSKMKRFVCRTNPANLAGPTNEGVG
jgi:hypothetical protein